jgi:predicted N-formylglutamate amidohydrolase
LPAPTGAALAPTRALPDDRKQDILARHYHPYRDLVLAWIAAAVRQGDRVVHISVHSFTPVLDGIARRADAGLLFDPRRPREARFCRAWQAGLADRASHWIVRRNYPYRGTSDGLVVALRRQFGAVSYLGVRFLPDRPLPSLKYYCDVPTPSA